MDKSAKVNLSIIIVARNEEENLTECLKTCEFAQEIILVDDNSTDRTVEIARTFGAKVYSRPLADDWGAQQTYGIHQATCSWIFLLDCDERITEELRISISQIVSKNEYLSYNVLIINRFQNFKIEHGPLRPKWGVRFFPKDGVFVTGRVHQRVHLKYPLKKISGKLIHYTYSSMEHYYSKMDKYAELSAKEYSEKGKKINFFLMSFSDPFGPHSKYISYIEDS